LERVEYVRLLREGSGVTGEKSRAVLPRGMQTSSKTVVEESAGVVDESKVNYAMATVVESVEGLTPTYEH